jgi:ectoine hydroxylase-related dioxygenase (phytanoyl-CoA dioxygenase family)
MALDPGQAWSETSAILSPGGVSFHDDYTLHGSGPNISGAPRRSLAVHMRTERSRPVDDTRTGLAAFIDDPELCPVIFGR